MLVFYLGFRTEMLGCLNDTDFRVKVYCIRNAFKVIYDYNLPYTFNAGLAENKFIGVR